jgi:hypothetical protein
MTAEPTNPFFDESGMLVRVESGDIGLLRKYFDRALSGEAVYRPRWLHLRAALLKNDLPMARLMATWGAQPSQDEWKSHVAERPQQAGEDALFLRRAGIVLLDAPPTRDAATPVPVAFTPSPAIAGRIPADWKAVLKGFHDAGAAEAVIAGGALRDLCTGRDVNDVDIFLSDRLFNKKLMAKAFALSGIKIHGQVRHHGYGWSVHNMTKGTSEIFAKVSTREARDGYGTLYVRRDVKHGAESWMVLGGEEQPVKYNLIFVKGPLGKYLRHQAAAGQNNAFTLVDHFDIALCQIAFDGTHVHTSKAFSDDLYNKTITLLKPRDLSTLDHLKKLTVKYPDYATCRHAHELLNDPPKPKALKR